MHWPRHVRNPAVRAAAATALALLARAPTGLSGAELRAGLRVGSAAASLVATGVAVSTTVPAVRQGMAVRDLPRPAWRWLLLDIPFGTVWTEETIYRGALGTLAERGLGPGWARLLQAVVFGLSHIPDARSAGEPVLGTVVVTGAAGWVFGWLTTHSGSLSAAMLTHLAINEAGAVAALLVQRRS
jgi:uncharacterized protein